MTKKKEIDIAKFSPQSILDMGLCPRAFSVLKDRYGDQAYDLVSHKADVINLIEEGKGDWVVTFCLELMTEEDVFHYCLYIIEEVLRDFPSKLIKRICNRLKDHITGKDDHSQDIQNIRKVLEEEIRNNPDKTWVDKSVKSLLQAMIHLIRACSEGEKINRRITCCVSSLIEAYALNETARDNFLPINNYRVSKYKDFGLYAMKLTKVWPFE